MIQFTVEGHPVPYQRMTQGQVKLMRIPDAKLSVANLAKKMQLKRYFEWKRYVNYHTLSLKFDRAPRQKVYLDVMIYFGKKVHGDPENVRKGIQDAIFEQDKFVAGAVDFDYDSVNPRCEITIREKGE